MYNLGLSYTYLENGKDTRRRGGLDGGRRGQAMQKCMAAMQT